MPHVRQRVCDFYPRPPRGGRLHRRRVHIHQPEISIHALREEGDLLDRWEEYSLETFLSTPSARRATTFAGATAGMTGISIHALREEGDVLSQGRFLAEESISIHALREEGDSERMASAISGSVFLSTPSARRATRQRRPGRHQQAISIHALREEGDLDEHGGLRRSDDFYPRPPRGGRPEFLRLDCL